MSTSGYTLLPSEDHDITLVRRSSTSTAHNESYATTRPLTDAPASTPPSPSSAATPSLITSYRNLPPHLVDYELERAPFLFSAKRAICKRASSRLVRSPFVSLSSSLTFKPFLPLAVSQPEPDRLNLSLVPSNKSARHRRRSTTSNPSSLRSQVVRSLRSSSRFSTLKDTGRSYLMMSGPTSTRRGSGSPSSSAGPS
jgi:hypothetical protein